MEELLVRKGGELAGLILIAAGMYCAFQLGQGFHLGHRCPCQKSANEAQNGQNQHGPITGRVDPRDSEADQPNDHASGQAPCAETDGDVLKGIHSQASELKATKA